MYEKEVETITKQIEEAHELMNNDENYNQAMQNHESAKEKFLEISDGKTDFEMENE